MKTLIFIIAIFYHVAGINAETLAFGFFKNYSKNEEFDYLQISLPLSMATEFKKENEYKIFSPYETEAELKKLKIEMKLAYSDEELTDIYQKLNCRAFIFGSFFSDNDQLVVKTQIFLPERKQILTIEIPGSVDMAVFNIIDRIKVYLNEFFQDKTKYLKTEITAGKKIALISNLDTLQLNDLAIAFMQKGYLVSAFGYNDFNDFAALVKPFYSTISPKTSLAGVFIAPENYNRLLLSSRENNVHNLEEIMRARQLVAENTTKYFERKNKALAEIQKRYQADYLIILNISSGDSFARAIDLKKNDLVWIQDNFDIGFFSSYSIENLVNQSIKEMNQIEKLKLDFEYNDEAIEFKLDNNSDRYDEFE